MRKREKSMDMDMKVKKYLINLSKYHGNVTEETRYLFTVIQSLQKISKDRRIKEIKVLKEVLKLRDLPYADNNFLMKQLEEMHTCEK